MPPHAPRATNTIWLLMLLLMLTTFRHRSNTSRDRGPRAFLEAAGCVVVLFWLSWRLAPICSVRDLNLNIYACAHLFCEGGGFNSNVMSEISYALHDRDATAGIHLLDATGAACPPWHSSAQIPRSGSAVSTLAWGPHSRTDSLRPRLPFVPADRCGGDRAGCGCLQEAHQGHRAGARSGAAEHVRGGPAGNGEHAHSEVRGVAGGGRRGGGLALWAMERACTQ